MIPSRCFPLCSIKRPYSWYSLGSGPLIAAPIIPAKPMMAVEWRSKLVAHICNKLGFGDIGRLRRAPCFFHSPLRPNLLGHVARGASVAEELTPAIEDGP